MVIKRKRKPDKLKVIIRILIVLIVATIILLVINVARYEYLRRSYAIPPEYVKLVENAAKEHNLDKYLIYAVIKTESGFKPDAVSNQGARGLMQIMSDTFEWLRDYRLHEDISFDSMFNPKDNIRYGVYLLWYHMTHYNGNTDNALAAYHAGDGAVDEWLKDERYSKDGENIEHIPVSDTAHYVSKVKKAYETYLKLYSVS